MNEAVDVEDHGVGSQGDDDDDDDKRCRRELVVDAPKRLSEVSIARTPGVEEHIDKSRTRIGRAISFSGRQGVMEMEDSPCRKQVEGKRC